MKLSNVEGFYYLGFIIGAVGAFYGFPLLRIPFPHHIVFVIAVFAVAAAVGYAFEQAYLRFRSPPPPRDPNDWSGPVL